MRSKAPRRKRKGKVQVFVVEKKDRYRRPRKYWRIKRPLGRKTKIGKKIYKFKTIQDQYGHIKGMKLVRRK